MFNLKISALSALLLATIPVAAHASYNAGRDVDAPRETIKTGGWEQGLVQGDPSLRHWNWSAMYSVVGRPRHVAPPVVNHGNTAVNPSQAHSGYAKPSQAAIPAKLLADLATARGLSGTAPVKHSTSTSLKFSTKKTIATLAYAKGYQSTPSSSYDFGGQSSSTAVQAKLLR
jgi:hypothetical protein